MDWSSWLLVTYVLLWGLVIVLAVAVFGLYRYMGQTLLGSRERRSSQGPAEGEEIERRSAVDIHGRAVTVPSADGLPTLVMFGSTTCRPCHDALGPLRAVAEQTRGQINIVLVCRGRDTADVAQFAAPLASVARIVPDPGWQLGSQYRVSTTPFAFVVDGEAVVRGKGAPALAEHFEALLHDHRAPTAAASDQLALLPR